MSGYLRNDWQRSRHLGLRKTKGYAQRTIAAHYQDLNVIAQKHITAAGVVATQTKRSDQTKEFTDD